MQGMMAAGHPYREKTGSGIKWDAATGLVSLWDRHIKLAEVPLLTTASAGSEQAKWDYWFNLRFTQDFPQVTHWWFGSMWTGRVRLSRSVAATSEGMGDEEAVMGFMQFVDEQAESLPYSLADTEPVQIFVPLPPLYSDYSNLPLRVALAELVLALLQGDIKADEWQIVTSLVEREKLADRLPTSTGATNWILEQTSGSLRRVFCEVLGLKEA